MKLGAKTEQVGFTNYYEVLEIPETAQTHEVHKAYTRAKATYSSENPALYSMFSPEEAREFMRLIEEAYSVLGNPALRKSYDDARARGERSPHVSLVVTSYGQSSAPASTPQPPAQATPPPPSSAQLENAHRALPDFSSPGATPEAVPPPPSSRAALPEGTGRTPLSTYKIDESFEEELRRTTEFDGRVLQRARLYKNISIDRLSEATRISRPYLMAVETNDYKSLPAAVFTRGFVVQIARSLGLNENQVAASYIKMFKAGGGK